MLLSVIIPVYYEPLLNKTLADFLEHSELGAEVEVIVVLDGRKTPEKPLIDPRVRVLRLKANRGMRNAINEGLKIAQGEYVMKVDAHCSFDQGFDRKMVEQMQPDWLMIPRRYSLDEKNWKRDDERPYRDYQYFEFPHADKYGEGLTILDWFKRNDKVIDDLMTFQGSCWLAQRKYFMRQVGLLDDREETYGTFAGDQHEIGLKYWLGGGAIKVNKKTWYAHLSKRSVHYAQGTYNRLFKTAPKMAPHHTWTAKHWMGNKEPNMMYPFSWIIKRFTPPTWPTDYED